MQLNLTYQVPFTESLEGANFIIQGTAINETTTSNNHKFLAEELMPAAKTLTGVPLLVDHENKVENIKGRVMLGSYNELGKRVDFKAMVMDETCKQMIRDGRLNSVSVGAMVKDVEEIDGELVPRGITFKELSLVAVPADSGATFSIAMKEAYTAGKLITPDPKVEVKAEAEIVVEPEQVPEEPEPVENDELIEPIEDKANIQQINPVNATQVADVQGVDNQIEMKGGLEKMSEIVEVKVDENAVLKAQLKELSDKVIAMSMPKVEEKALVNEFEVAETVEKGYNIVQEGNSFTYKW